MFKLDVFLVIVLQVLVFSLMPMVHDMRAVSKMENPMVEVLSTTQMKVPT